MNKKTKQFIIAIAIAIIFIGIYFLSKNSFSVVTDKNVLIININTYIDYISKQSGIIPGGTIDTIPNLLKSNTIQSGNSTYYDSLSFYINDFNNSFTDINNDSNNSNNQNKFKNVIQNLIDYSKDLIEYVLLPVVDNNKVEVSKFVNKIGILFTYIYRYLSIIDPDNSIYTSIIDSMSNVSSQSILSFLEAYASPEEMKIFMDVALPTTTLLSNLLGLSTSESGGGSSIF